MPTDKETTLFSLKQKIKTFCDEREWDQFHDGKELAVGMIIEAAELLEHFRWKTKDEVREVFANKVKRAEVEEELADIFYYIIRIAQMYNIDLAQAVDKKMAKNAIKYPVEKAKGSSKKYNEL